MKIIVPDTSFFIQCKWLDQIPWSDLGAQVRMVVTQTCMHELDTFKGQGNARRAKRAKQALAEIYKAYESEKLGTVHMPTPGLELIVDQQSFDAPGSDSMTPDQRLVREALMVQESHAASVVFLTVDTTARIRADRAGVCAFEIPAAWMAPPEPSEDMKRLREMEVRISALETTSPRLEIAFNAGDKRVEGDHCPMLRFIEPATEEELDALISLAAELMPAAVQESKPSDQNKATAGKLILTLTDQLTYAPSQRRWDLYSQVEYPMWLTGIRNYLSTLSKVQSQLSRTISVSVEIANNGTTPADSLLVRVETTGGLVIYPPEKNIEDYVSRIPMLPKPPSPPKPEPLIGAGLMGTRIPPNFPHLQALPPFAAQPGPMQFVWEPEDDDERYSRRGSMGELRHGMRLTFTLLIGIKEGTEQSKPKLHVYAGARNIPQEVVARIEIRPRVEATTTCYPNLEQRVISLAKAPVTLSLKEPD